MIDSTSSSSGTSGANALPSDLTNRAGRRESIGADRFSTGNAEHLQAALAGEPEVRPEMVARGQALAADPGYPSPETIQRLAGLIIDSPDLSEDQS
jgi:hypothetical protein